MSNISLDENSRPVLAAISSSDGTTIVNLYADPTTHRLLTSSGGSGDVTGPASSTDNAIVRFDGATGKLVQNSGITIGDTDNVVIPSASTLAWSTDLFLKRVAAKQLSITGDGTGASTNVGWVLGYGVSSGVSALWSSVDTLTDYTTSRLYTTTAQTVLNAPASNGSTYLTVANTAKFGVFGTAGKGPEITPGTATTDVAALSLVRTNNDTSVATGVKFAFTDTSSAAGFLPFQVLGGASATTNLFSLSKAGAVAQGGKTTTYNSVATAGWGTPAIYGSGRSTAQTDAVASVATYTVGAADGSFIVSSNVNVTTSTTHSFTVTCAYTDETNNGRTLTLDFLQLGGGTPIATITNVTGAGPYQGIPTHIRCKAATSITIATTGTFTTVTYNAEGVIQQIM